MALPVATAKHLFLVLVILTASLSIIPALLQPSLMGTPAWKIEPHVAVMTQGLKEECCVAVD